MALRLRIRHKLMLGLALVFGLLVISLGGAIQALSGYSRSLRTMDARSGELEIIRDLRDVSGILKNSVTQLAKYGELLSRLQKHAGEYRDRLQETRRKLPSLQANEEERYLNRIEIIIDKMVQECKQLPNYPILDTTGNTSDKLTPLQTFIKEKSTELHQQILGLLGTVETAVHQMVPESQSNYFFHQSMAIITCGSAFLLLFLLGRLLYRWIAAPIKELQTKVAMLSAGQFEGRVEIKSGDEMQDLAESFNYMSDRLQSMYRDLEKQVQERSKQLVRSERLAGIGFLAAGVAHEINNPLSSITFGAEALERRIKPILSQLSSSSEVETIIRYLRMIQEESSRCKGITQKLLEFSRVSDKPRELTDITELLQSVLSMVQCLPHHTDKRIRAEIEVRPHLWVSAPEIKQVILNLVINALESMDADGLLTIHMEEVHDQIVLSFIDTGCGMDQEVLDNLFEPFFTRSRSGKGTGLGLSISHRIITQHGGMMEAQSAGPGQGSNFTIRLPLKLAEAPSQSHQEAVMKKAA